MDRDATVLDGNPAGLQLAKPVADRRIERQRAHQAPKPAQLTSQVGEDDAFILAWGRSHAALRATQLQLAASVLVSVALAATVAFLAWRSEHKEPLVFVRDALGNVVQADAGSFVHAGEERNDPEIKGFLRRWVLDAFTWTPLDVEDRLAFAGGELDAFAGEAEQCGGRAMADVLISERRPLPKPTRLEDWLDAA
jgi:hypothetical protein